MEFDINRVYTSVNADELKLGSKVCISDNMNGLKNCVKKEIDIGTLKEVLPESNSHRFVTDGGMDWILAYLISEPEEKKLKVSDLKVHDVLKHKTNNVVYSVEGIDYDNNSVFFGGDWSDDKDLGRCWEKVEK